MADERKYYVLCNSNCKFESMTKEQILTAIEQAISTGEIKDVNSGFVTTIKEQNANYGLKFWIGTTAEYNAIADKRPDTLYILSDETTWEDMNAAFDELRAELEMVKTFVGEVEILEAQVEILEAQHEHDISVLNNQISKTSDTLTAEINRVGTELAGAIEDTNKEINKEINALDASVAGLVANSKLIPLYVRSSDGGFQWSETKYIENISKHTLFIINFNDVRTSVLAIANGTNIRGQATYTDTTYITEYIISLTLNGDNVTYLHNTRRTFNMLENTSDKFTITTGDDVIASIYAIGGF